MFKAIPLSKPVTVKQPGRRAQVLSWSVEADTGEVVALFKAETNAWAYAHRRNQLATQVTTQRTA